MSISTWEVPWAARTSNQSILREINREYSLEGLFAEAEVPVFWSSDANRWLIGKVPDAGKDQGQKEKRVSEDEMAGWHHWCNEHECGQSPGDDEGQVGLACYSPWGHKESDMTGQMNNNKWKASIWSTLSDQRYMARLSCPILKSVAGTVLLPKFEALLTGSFSCRRCQLR